MNPITSAVDRLKAVLTRTPTSQESRTDRERRKRERQDRAEDIFLSLTFPRTEKKDGTR